MSILIYKQCHRHPNQKKTPKCNYAHIGYIATRPGAVKNEGMRHGLFGKLEPGEVREFATWQEAARLVRELSYRRVNMYRGIISFSPETAAELGLTDHKAWEDYIERHILTLAKYNGIRVQNLQWAAAHHNERGHPHIHVVFWDKNQRTMVPFVHPSIPDKIRRQLIRDTFADKIQAYCETKQRAREQLTAAAVDLVDQVVKLSQGRQFMNMFEYVIQFGAILAVILLYFNKLNPFSKPTVQAQKDTWQLWAKVIIAVLPSVVVGLPLNDWMDKHLHTPLVVATTLILYGVLFIVLENYLKNKHAHITSVADITYQTALLIGLFQVLSIVPGTSRSGATILGALLIGTSRYVATEFSFFLAIPTMVGVSILKIGKYLLQGNGFTGEQWVVLLTGSVVSFLVAIVAIKWLLKFVQTHDFKPFGWYRIILGAIVLLVMFL